MAYDAGTAFLQVIPSFRGVQRLFQQEAEKLGRAVEDEVGDGVGDGVERGGRDADEQGRRAGRRYGGMFADSFGKAVDKASGSLSKLEIEGDTDPIRKAIADVRKDLVDLGKRKLGINLDEDQMVSAIENLRGRLRDIMSKATDAREFTDATAAESHLGTFAELVKAARQRGLEAGNAFDDGFFDRRGGAFSAAFAKNLDKAVKAIPKIAIDGDTDPVRRKLADVRKDLVDLSRQKIGVDIDERQVAAALENLRSRLQKVMRSAKDGQTFTNADSAESLIGGLSDLVEMSRRRGLEAGDAFAEPFEKRLHAALSNLPPAKVDGDISPAQAALGKLRTEIEGLASKRIGVDIDANTAFAIVQRLQHELAELARTSPDVAVKVQATKAALDLREVLRLADKVDGLDASVNVKVDGLQKLADSAGLSLSRLGYLISIGASVGSVIAPAAAAAAAAIGAIGTAALSAGSGIGVAILAFSGIGEAVKQMANAEKQQATAAASVERSNLQLAGAAEAVSSAERSLANTREQVASGARRADQQVIDSKRAVGDAVRGVEEAERGVLTATRRVGEAQRDVADAERARRQAVVDLTQAIRDARREQEDAAFQLEGNALAQRQAVLDIAEAKAKLDAILANPRASEVEREQARITYEQRLLQMRELTTTGQRLADDQAEANKAGVEGSKRVQQAQERVVDTAEGVRAAQQRVADAVQGVADAQQDVADAQRKVGDAQRGVADAVEAQQQQQRQGAFQIAQAQQAVINSQRALEQATVSAGTAGSEAMRNLEYAMSQLSPAGQKFAQFLFGLKDELKQLQDAAQESMLPGIQSGMQILVDRYLTPLRTFITSMGHALGDMFMEGVDALENPVWQDFFSFLGQTAVPTLRQLWTTSLLFGRGIASVYLALTPFNRGFGSGLLEMAQKFAFWAETLQYTAGYRDFLDYVSRVGPKVVALLLNMGEFVGRLVIAAAPVGEVVLAIFNALFDTLNALPLGVLTTMIGLFAIFGTTMYAMALGTALVRTALSVTGTVMSGWNKTVEYGTIATGRWTAAMAAATIKTGQMGGALTTATAAGLASRGVLGGLSTLLGGPVGVAVLGATVAIAGIASTSADYNRKVESLTDSLVELANAFRKTGSDSEVTGQAVQDTFTKIVQSNPDLQRGVIALNDMGVGFESLARAATGSKEDLSTVNAAIEAELDRLGKQLDTALLGGNGHTPILGGPARFKEIGDQIGQWRRFKDSLNESTTALTEQDAAARLQAQAMGIATDATNRLEEAQTKFISMTGPVSVDMARQIGAAYNEASTQIDVLTKFTDAFAGSAGTASERVDALRGIIQLHTGAAMAASDAEDAEARTLLNLADSVKAHGNSLAMDSQAGLANRDALKQAATATRERFLADIASEVPMDKALQRHNDRIAALRVEAKEHKLDKAATEDLIKKYGDIPEVVKTAFKTDNFDVIFDQLARAQTIQQALKGGKTLAQAKAAWDQEYKKLHYPNFIGPAAPGSGRARGGPIYGPGTKSSDSIPIWASDGEYMQRASAVDYYGVGIMDALNQRRIPREYLDKVGTYAKGGLVQWPIKVDISKAWVPKDDWVVKSVAQYLSTFTGSGDWPSSPSAQRGDSGVWHKVVALIKSTGPLSGSFGNSYRPGDPLWHGCVPMDTQVLTRRGWVAYEDVEVGVDETIGYNPETESSEWTRIVGMYHYDDAELWTISNRLWAAEVTPGHRWLTDDGITETRDFTDRTSVVLAVPGASGDVGKSVCGLEVTGRRRAEVFCPTTELGTWTARQGGEVFLTGNSGRAVDWMGYEQNALATFLSNRNPLELIHRTSKRDFAYTRGRNQGSFDQQLMNEHRNHIHIAMDEGGFLQPGWNPPVWNGTGRVEPVLNPTQWQAIYKGARGGDGAGQTINNWNFKDTTLTASKLGALQAAQAAYERDGRAR